jgi:hypothetical protein
MVIKVEAARRTTMSGRHTSGLTKLLDQTEAWLNRGLERFVAKLAVVTPFGDPIPSARGRRLVPQTAYSNTFLD